MSDNKYPADPMQDLNDLGNTVDANAAAQRRESLTSASKGWQIPNQPLPPAPDDGGHLTAVGDEPYWTESSGSFYSLRPQMSQGVSVSDPPDFTSGTDAGPTYDNGTRNMINALRADAAGTKIALDNLLSSLRGGGVIDM
ncbi:hypothetical protein ACIBEJ_48625 [Nonomuraea sp. NPDC050790]|uniref:hypothetical protein n=1 Tax=Nonomuraea sp. NPDC050790 TaxID=3364371 RepID=UPI00379AB6E5